MGLQIQQNTEITDYINIVFEKDHSKTEQCNEIMLRTITVENMLLHMRKC